MHRTLTDVVFGLPLRRQQRARKLVSAEEKEVARHLSRKRRDEPVKETAHATLCIDLLAQLQWSP